MPKGDTRVNVVAALIIFIMVSLIPQLAWFAGIPAGIAVAWMQHQGLKSTYKAGGLLLAGVLAYMAVRPLTLGFFIDAYIPRGSIPRIEPFELVSAGTIGSLFMITVGILLGCLIGWAGAKYLKTESEGTNATY